MIACQLLLHKWTKWPFTYMWACVKVVSFNCCLNLHGVLLGFSERTNAKSPFSIICRSSWSCNAHWAAILSNWPSCLTRGDDIEVVECGVLVKPSPPVGCSCVVAWMCQVAQIVAEAMHNYLLFESMLQVKLVPLEKIHSRL